MRSRPWYTADDLYAMEHLEYAAGVAPFLRGPYSTMYAMQPWTIRQYAGFSTAEESNAFYRRNLAAGQKGLSVAFDLATHRGYDSDNERVSGDVGKAGVAIDSVEDMKILFDQIPLGQMSVSMTMNGAVLPIMAFYIVAAEEQGVATKDLSGTIQNDILKEFMVRNTYIYPPGPSMRMIGDIFRYCSANMPKFNCISISGYHMQEAGATADIELGYTLADGLEYMRTGIQAGPGYRHVRAAPQLLLGHRHEPLHGDRQDARGARAVGEDRQELQSEESEVDGAAHALADLGLEPDGAGRLQQRGAHLRRGAGRGPRATRSRCTPTRSTRRSRCRRISRRASRATRRSTCRKRPASPKWSIPGPAATTSRRLTHELMHKAWHHIQEIEALGGMAKAIETGHSEDAHRRGGGAPAGAHRFGRETIVGVNKYQPGRRRAARRARGGQPGGARIAVARGWPRSARTRDQRAVDDALAALTGAAETGTGNLLELAVRRGARARHAGRDLLGARKGLRAVPGGEPHHLRRLFVGERGRPGVPEGAAAGRGIRAAEGRRPRILIAKMGQDGHDRGAKVIATAFADLGFDVDIGPLFQTPREVARMAVENDVHVLGVSSLAGGHKTLVPEVIAELKKLGREDILVVVGGVIPPQDYDGAVPGGRDGRVRSGHGHPGCAQKILTALIGSARAV